MKKELAIIVVGAILSPLLAITTLDMVSAQNQRQQGPTCPPGWTLSFDNIHCLSCPSWAHHTADEKCQSNFMGSP